MKAPSTFALYRDEDPTGVSGTGFVAVGALLDEHTVVLRWLPEPRSTVLRGHLDEVIRVHGHDGRTRLVWLHEGDDIDE